MICRRDRKGIAAGGRCSVIYEEQAGRGGDLVTVGRDRCKLPAGICMDICIQGHDTGQGRMMTGAYTGVLPGANLCMYPEASGAVIYVHTWIYKSRSDDNHDNRLTVTHCVNVLGTDNIYQPIVKIMRYRKNKKS